MRNWLGCIKNEDLRNGLGKVKKRLSVDIGSQHFGGDENIVACYYAIRHSGDPTGNFLRS